MQLLPPLVFKPIGAHLRVLAWHADNIFDPEHTLGFTLQDINELYPPFEWPAFCWPFKVRNDKVQRWLKTGKLPANMDLINVAYTPYNLIIGDDLCKVKETLPERTGHARGFLFYPVKNTTAIMRYHMLDEEREKNMQMLLNSYVGAVKSRVHFELHVDWYIYKAQVHESTDLRKIGLSSKLIGYNKRDKILLTVPTAAFKNSAYDHL